jgi:hypothetical protein
MLDVTIPYLLNNVINFEVPSITLYIRRGFLGILDKTVSSQLSTWHWPWNIYKLSSLNVT